MIQPFGFFMLIKKVNSNAHNFISCWAKFEDKNRPETILTFSFINKM